MMQRKYYIDWVRILAFLLLIFFHCAMPFVTFGWEIKNQETSLSLSRFIWWLHQWRLPLLFFVSGVGIHYSLQKRTVLSFTGERITRLLIPLLFAMFFTIPIQVYFEWTQKGRITGSYANFYPQVWDMIPYPEGALTWSHMWFVVYLFVFCILLIPVFLLFKTSFFKSIKSSFSSKIADVYKLVTLFVPLAIYHFTLYLAYPEQQSLLDDWFLFVCSLTLVFYGYILGGTANFWNTCEKYRFPYLMLALACTAFLYYRYWWNFNLPKQDDIDLYIYGTVNSLHIWILILALLGYAKKHLNFRNRFLDFTNEAVYPFYILHQTIIVGVGYYVVQLNLPIVLKIVILIFLTFTIISFLYSIVIKPYKFFRILYGVKSKGKNNHLPAV